MVKFTKVMHTEDVRSFVRLDGVMLFPTRWLLTHALMHNLQTSVTLGELIDSDKWSWRMLGDFVADCDQKKYQNWQDADWMLLSFENREVIKLVSDGRGFKFGWNGQERGFMRDCPYRPFGPGTFMCSLNASLEREYNCDMLKFYKPKIPVHLESTHPCSKDMKSTSIPVVQNNSKSNRRLPT